MKVKTVGCALFLALFVPLGVHAQTTGQVTGVVRASDGQLLSSVTVMVLQTQLRSETAANGRYTISNVPVGRQVVQVTSIGYGTAEQTVTVAAGSPTVVDFTLETRAVALSEIVVVGYGTQRREQVTGAVSSVSSEQFVKGPARDAAALISGKMAGLAVIQPSGDPTDDSQIQLRGRTTMQGPTQPLVLIDGVPGDLSTVAAEDIDAISVLKDGSAAAVYGSRASNGVILITTKRHAGGAPTLRYDGYVSQSRLYKSPDFLTASDYRQLIGEGHGFDDLGFETDWQSQLIRQPISHRHNLLLSGGAANTNYTASVNYEDAQGIFERSDKQEVTVRANIRHSMFDGRLEAEGNLLSLTESEFRDPGFNGAWRQTLIRNPTDRVVDDEGNWQQRGAYMYTNPVSMIREQNGEVEQRTTRLHGTLTFRPFSQLRLSLMGGTSRSNELEGWATTFQHPSHTFSASGGTAGRNTESEEDRIVELTGTLSEQLGDHNVTLLGGYGYQDFLEESFGANNSRFPTDLFGWDQLQRGSGLGDGIAGLGSDKSSYKLIGFFSRLNYDWRNRYMLMGSVRYEGNSRFGADHKWGMFPAISAGWRLSEEPFMEGVNFLDDLRLRVGYGVTGIAPNQSYLSLTSYSYGARFLYDGEWIQSLGPARNPNPSLRWEEKSELNMGLNFSMFDARLSGAFDVYRRDTKDMLYNFSVPVPPYLSSSILANVGTMRNSGIEAELSYDVFNRPGFRWTTSANWSRNTNKLVSLSDDTFSSSDCFQPGNGHTGEPIQQFTHQVCVGGPVGNFYGYKSLDIDEDGVWIVEDSAGNPISMRDATARDRHVLGNGLPKQYFAWNNTAQLGNVDLSLNMRGAADFQILNYLRMYYGVPRNFDYNMLKEAFEPVYGKRTVNYDLVYVSYFIEDGDYVKLDNATLGYTFGPGSLGRLSSVVSNARVYVSGRNLFTITGYKGLDPEVNTNGLAPGNDSRDTYPTTRFFTAGMTFNF